MDIQKAVDALKADGVVLCQTDTIPGLHARARSKEAVQKVIDLKGRQDKNGFVVLVADDGMLNSVVNEVPSIGWDLVDFATKPTTIIFDDAINLPETVTGEDGSVAIRMVKEGPIHDILRKLREPLISTSANKSGSPAAKQIASVDTVISDACDAIVGEGLAGTGQASSLIRLKNNGEVSILRK